MSMFTVETYFHRMKDRMTIYPYSHQGWGQVQYLIIVYLQIYQYLLYLSVLCVKIDVLS